MHTYKFCRSIFMVTPFQSINFRNYSTQKMRKGAGRAGRKRHLSTERSIADVSHLQSVAARAIDDAAEELCRLSNEIWSNPELYYKEYKAHRLLTDFLKSKKFSVNPSYKLETAFRAVYEKRTNSSPVVAVLCEYDALPKLGHACGHNLIAEVGIGTALGVKAAMESCDVNLGRLCVLGTPAEEEGGGKIDMIREGAFEEIDFAVMSHPGFFSAVHLNFSAMQEVRVVYKGRESHAACDPWEGVNALDAAVMAYGSISCLRQQMRDHCRVHGIITKGGVAPNIIPAEAELFYYIRAPTAAELQELVAKVKMCFEAAATATGCEVELHWERNHYTDVRTNRVLADVYQRNAVNLGVEFTKDPKLLGKSAGSTDMGNVSYCVPSIHPTFYIGGKHVEHTPGFAELAGSSAAQYYSQREAKVLAFTVLDILCQPGLLQEMKKEFSSDMGLSSINKY